MSQDQVVSSEDLSDFNNEKVTSIESVPTSPESNNGNSKSVPSLLKQKISSNLESSKSINSNIKKSHVDEFPVASDLMDETPDIVVPPATPLSSTSTPSQTPKLKDENLENKISKIEKKEKKDKEKKEKKEKKSQRSINFASGVSTSVPLTGERPKPDSHPSMDDGVLLAIFIILFDNDPNSKGMTVKQICDVLLERHPDMSKLSSKTSNLVSAKLNAYVKKVEKGDSSIHYALSRDWADSSPKRMVYVYRGILSPNYPSYVKNIIEELRKKELANSALNDSNNSDNSISNNNNNNNNNNDNNNNIGNNNIDNNNNSDKSKSIDNQGGSENLKNLSNVSKSKPGKLNDSNLNSVNRSQSPLTQDLSSLKSISPAGLQLDKSSPFGNGSIDFAIPQLSVPYSVAPVTASLNITMPMQNMNSHQLQNNANMNSSMNNNVKINIGVNNKNNSIKQTNPIKSDFANKRINQYLTAIPDSDDEEDVYNSLRADFEDDDEDDNISVYENHGYYRRGSEIITERIPSGIGKRSKSISFINKRTKSNSSSVNQDFQQRQNSSNLISQDNDNSINNKSLNQSKRIVTAAAVTPRVPRKSFANTPSAAAAVAALRAVVLGTYNGTANDSVNAITSSIMNDTSVEPSISAKWLETVRSGFLNQDIDSPEDISLAELETLFA